MWDHGVPSVEIYDARWRVVGRVTTDGTERSFYRVGEKHRFAFEKFGTIAKESGGILLGVVKTSFQAIERHLDEYEPELVHPIRDDRLNRYTGYYFTRYDNDLEQALVTFYKARIDISHYGYSNEKWVASSKSLVGYGRMNKAYGNDLNWGVVYGGAAFLILDW